MQGVGGVYVKAEVMSDELMLRRLVKQAHWLGWTSPECLARLWEEFFALIPASAELTELAGALHKHNWFGSPSLFGI